MTLLEFVKYTLAYAYLHDVCLRSLHRQNWHRLVYRLAKEADLGHHRPAFLDDLSFDWDGDRPKCPQLAAILDGAPWSIEPEIYERWQKQLASKDIATQQAWQRCIDEWDASQVVATPAV
jgi:hypothetical protein